MGWCRKAVASAAVASMLTLGGVVAAVPAQAASCGATKTLISEQRVAGDKKITVSDYKIVYKNCSTFTQSMRLDIALGVDSKCKTVKPYHAVTYYWTTFSNQFSWFRGMASCN